MFNKFTLLVIFLAFILSSFSFYIRVNFWPFVNFFGLYQGDLWYFFTHYGRNIINNFFYPIEYPVGFVIIQKLAAQISQNIFGQFTYENFIKSHALMMIPLTLATIFLIYKISKVLQIDSQKTFMYLLLSPTFFIAQTTNYDIYPVFLTTLSIYLLINKKFNLSFFSLAVGTVIKIYPGFLLPLFVLFALSLHINIIQLVKCVAIFLSTIFFLNLPFMLFNFEYWIFPYLWQTQNPQRYDPNTLSFYLTYLGLINYRLLFFAVIVGGSWLISFIFYRKRLLSIKNFILLSYLICFSVILGSQVNTPQYLLWFLPFVALSQIPNFWLWMPFDFINSLILFSYFKLTSELRWILENIFLATVLYFIFLYILLIYYLRRSLSEKK